MNNIKTKELDNLKAASINKINTYIVIGETKCGMKIRLAIREQIENSKIVIVSACPDGNWILQV